MTASANVTQCCCMVSTKVCLFVAADGFGAVLRQPPSPKITSPNAISQEATRGVVQRFGKYSTMTKPGIGWIIPGFDEITGSMSLKMQQADVAVETKTKDNVFCNLVVCVMYKVA